MPDFKEEIQRLESLQNAGEEAREAEATASMDLDAVTKRMLQRSVDGTPAKRLITSLVRAAVSDSLRQASPMHTLCTALAQAKADLEAVSSGPIPGYEGLGAEAKVRLLEMRETVHRSISRSEG